MASLGILLVLLTVSVLVVRIATVALVQTGLSREVAEFQARSAFTGTGFTTEESDSLLKDPARRRIIKLLMLLRGAGITVAITTLILSFINTSGTQQLQRLGWLSLGCLILWYLATNRWVDHHLTIWIGRFIDRIEGREVADYAELLRLSDAYSVRELTVEKEDWLSGKRLRDLDLFEEGILVLGIHRSDNQYIGTPRGNIEVKPKDIMVLYGRSKGLKELDERRRGSGGDLAHGEAVVRQEQDEENESRKQNNMDS